MITSIHLRAPFAAADVYFRRTSTGLSGHLHLDSATMPQEQVALWSQAIGLLTPFLLEGETPLALIVEPASPIITDSGDPEADPPVPPTTAPGFSIALTSSVAGEERTRSITPSEETRAFVADMWSALAAQIGD